MHNSSFKRVKVSRLSFFSLLGLGDFFSPFFSFFLFFFSLFQGSFKRATIRQAEYALLQTRAKENAKEGDSQKKGAIRQEYKSRENFFPLLTAHLSTYYNLAAQYSFESFLLFSLTDSLVTWPANPLLVAVKRQRNGYNGAALFLRSWRTRKEVEERVVTAFTIQLVKRYKCIDCFKFLSGIEEGKG